MFDLKNKTVAQFISDFEKQFGSYLVSPPAVFKKVINKQPVVYTKHFGICRGETAISDWDLRCHADPAKIDKQIVKQIEKYVLNYPGFAYAKVFLYRSSKMKEPAQHISKWSNLQIMAFLEDEKYAPFIDFNLYGIGNRLVRKIYSQHDERATLDWALITVWRKLINTSRQYLILSATYVFPLLTARQAHLFLNDPEFFFQKTLARKYKNIIKFFKRHERSRSQSQDRG